MIFNEMTSLIFYAVASFGLAYIVGQSKISLPIRNLIAPPIEIEFEPWGVIRSGLVALLECPACFGFWTGLACGILAAPFWEIPMLAVFTCGSNYLLAKFAGLLEEKNV